MGGVFFADVEKGNVVLRHRNANKSVLMVNFSFGNCAINSKKQNANKKVENF